MGGAGSFNDARDACEYTSGARWEFGGALGTPAEGSTQFPVTNWRLLEPGGNACMTGKILGVGRTVLDVEGDVVLFENPSLTTYRITCPDGSTYGNDQPGTCEDFGLRYLDHETPGVYLACDGSEERCQLDLWGTTTGEENVTTCDF
jgi:hypothetical protein